MSEKSKEQSSPKLEFFFDEEKRAFIAKFTPGDKEKKISFKYIANEVENQGYGHLLLLESEAKAFVEHVNSNTECQNAIAKETDASLEVWVSHDAMRAYVTCEPAHGGKNINKEQFDKEVRSEGIVVPYNEDIPIILESGKSIENRLIAEGVYPIRPVSKFSRVIDKNLKGITKVDTNCDVLRRHKFGLHQDGMDVYGNILSPVPEKLEGFSKEIVGCGVSEANNKVLVALESGHPVFFGNSVRIDEPKIYKTLTKKSYDTIKHDGSIYIDGDIEADIVIDVSGDCIVNGNMANSLIKAGGDVIIVNGVVGGANKTSIDNEDKLDTEDRGAKIICKGDVYASFVDNAYIEAGGEILIQEYASHSTLRSCEKIILGANNGAGKLIGGCAQARMGVAAKIIGSSAHIPTKVTLKPNQEDIIKYKALHREITHSDIKLHALRTALAKLTETTKDMPPASVRAIEQPIKDDIEELIMKISHTISKYNSLISKCRQTDFAKVISNATVFGGTIINIIDEEKKYIDDIGPTEFCIANNELTTNSLMNEHLQ